MIDEESSIDFIEVVMYVLRIPNRNELTNTIAQTDDETAALALQKSTKLPPLEAALEARKHRRTRTLCDFRYVTRRFMKRCPGLARLT